MADGMAEWQKKWQNGRMAGMATYVLFMVHADNDTLIFYSIEIHEQKWYWKGLLIVLEEVHNKYLQASCQGFSTLMWHHEHNPQEP